MGVRSFGRAAPWWLTYVVVSGLAFLFLGERVLVGAGMVRLLFSGVGGIGLLGALAWRFVSWTNAIGEAKRSERLLLLAYVGCALAAVGYAVSSERGMSLLGMDFADGDTERRYEVIVQVISSIVLAASLLPALGAQWALAAHRHAGHAAFGVESLRVREIATGGLSLALAGGFLMLGGYITSERDGTIDFSYFKTSSPGTGTQELVRNLGSPVRVLLFYPEVNEVKDEVQRYFRSLASSVGNIEVETHDRMIEPTLAREHRVTSDGTILFIRDDRTERISLPAELRSARATLRDFDRSVQEQLMRLARDVRVAYLTIGHGEINDPSDDPGGALLPDTDPLRQTRGLREILRVLNYRVEDLGLRQGLGAEVPEDAAIVLVVGPQRAFLDEELGALDRYAARGGALLLALDPESEFQMGPLEDRLSVTYNKTLLANDRQFARRRGNISDRQYIVTDGFSAHEAVTTLSRTSVGSGIILAGAGHLEVPENASSDDVRRTFVVRSLSSTFADLNGNFEFDAATEQRAQYNLVAAIEAIVPDTVAESEDVPVVSAGLIDGASSTEIEQDETGTGTMRALVYADAQMFSDGILRAIGLNAALVADGVRWLGGEEDFGGEIESEEDVPIVHTNVEDVAWFYFTILGAPMAVLALGFVNVYRRRRKGRQTA